MIKKWLLWESASLVKEILTEYEQYCGNSCVTELTRQCWTNLVLTAVNCKLCHILCNSDSIISGCIASESDIVSNEVEGSGCDVLGENVESQENSLSEWLVSCLIFKLGTRHIPSH